MIVLLIAALTAVSLLAGAVTIARSRTRERQRRDRQHRARMAAAAESRAEEERRRAALEASDALTSVLPAIRLPWPRQPQGPAPHADRYPSFSDYPQFPAAVPFRAQEEPERTSAPACPAERLAPPPPPSAPAAPGPPLAERSAPADRPHRRPGHGTHRGGHAKRRHG